MLAKPVMRRCIPPSHRKIYFMYIGLPQVISQAFGNKPKKCRRINFNKYIYARLHSLQLYYNCYQLLGDIIIGVIATLNAFIFTRHCKERLLFKI